MGLGVQPEDLDIDKAIVFAADVPVEFVCLAPKDNETSQTIILECKVLSGAHAGALTSLFISKKRTTKTGELNKMSIRKLREFALAFFTEEELRSSEQPLSRLMLRKFSAIPAAPREWGGKTYQDFSGYVDLGESQPEAVDMTATSSTENVIPF